MLGASGYMHTRMHVHVYAHMYVSKRMHLYNCMRQGLALGGLQSSLLVHFFPKILFCLSDSHIFRDFYDSPKV